MTVHALLLTVCQMLREGEAQIQLKPDEHCMWPLKDYSEYEAREAYERVAKYHGWPGAPASARDCGGIIGRP